MSEFVFFVRRCLSLSPSGIKNGLANRSRSLTRCVELRLVSCSLSAPRVLSGVLDHLKGQSARNRTPIVKFFFKSVHDQFNIYKIVNFLIVILI